MCMACALFPPTPNPAQALLRAPGTSRRGATGGKASREVMP